MTTSKILVTGGAGYIGSVLVEELLKNGYQVRVFDRLYFGPASLSHLKDKIELIEGDVRKFPSEVLKGVCAVAHLGSLSNDPTADFDPSANHAVNFEGTMRVAEACKKMGVRRFTFASSCAVIGFHVNTIADENFKPNPQSEYAQSKLDAEQGLLGLAADDFCPVIYRQATVYGFSRRMRYDLVVNTMVKDAFSRGRIQVYCAGEMWRPLVEVRDVARAHIAALEAPEAKVKGQLFNLVYDNFNIFDLAHFVQKALKSRKEVEVEVLSGKENRSYRVAGQKLNDRLGFVPQYAVDVSAIEMYDLLAQGQYVDFSNPIYYNINWMKQLVEKFGKARVF